MIQHQLSKLELYSKVFFASRNSLKRQSCQGSTADQEVWLPFVVKECFPEGFCLAVMDTAEFQFSTYTVFKNQAVKLEAVLLQL